MLFNPEEIGAIAVGAAGGLWSLVVVLKKSFLYKAAQSWPCVEGKIIESFIYRESSNKINPFKDVYLTHFKVLYEFLVINRYLIGNTPRICGDWFWNNRLQQEFVDRFHPGQAVLVYYEPGNPKRNCIDRTDTSSIIIHLALGIGGLGLACLIPYLKTL